MGADRRIVLDVIEAAGGVVVRTVDGGRTEVLLIHRPRRDDWTLPKGKRERSETHEQCALREVHEETGQHCELGVELPSTSYRARSGRLKIVRYWMMRALGGEFRTNREVDEIRWVAVDRVGDLLTHDRDRMVVEALADVALSTR